jgi:hypothetical protein
MNIKAEAEEVGRMLVEHHVVAIYFLDTIGDGAEDFQLR